MTDGITAMTGILAGLSGVALGWLAFGRDRRQDLKGEIKAFTRLEVLLEELSQKVGKLGEQIACLGRDLTGHDRRLALLEQRVDTLEKARRERRSPATALEPQVMENP